MLESRLSELDEGPDAATESTASLLILAKRGTFLLASASVDAIVAILGRWAHGRVPMAARDLVDTDDLVQSTLIRAFNNLHHFEARGEGAFLAYLRQILLNRIRDHARRARRRPTHVELDDSVDVADERSPLEEAIGRERLEAYETALGQLGEAQRTAVMLRLEMGMRYREIAEATDSPSADAARSLVGRGMVNLARLMRDHHESA